MKGQRLKELREERNLKQHELAKILNISSSSIGMYETDKREPDDELKLKIAIFFNVSVAYLIGETDERNAKQNDDIEFFAIYEDYKKFDEEDKNLLKTMFEALKKKRKK